VDIWKDLETISEEPSEPPEPPKLEVQNLADFPIVNEIKFKAKNAYHVKFVKPNALPRSWAIKLDEPNKSFVAPSGTPEAVASVLETLHKINNPVKYMNFEEIEAKIIEKHLEPTEIPDGVFKPVEALNENKSSVNTTSEDELIDSILKRCV